MDQQRFPESEEPFLDESERAAVLSLVQRAVEAYVREKRQIAPALDPGFPSRTAGVFVTLSRQGQLRGCIGVPEPDRPLPEILVHCAIAAATEDPRFSPVRPGELAQLDYEISLLSPLHEIRSPGEIHAGRHGLLIQSGTHRGLLLPQVAREHGWNRDQFLDQVCRKAGLPSGAWREKGSRIWIFTAEVFGKPDS